MDRKLIAAIEAMIFASGEPLSINRISEVLDVKTDIIIKCCDILTEEHHIREGGIELLKLENQYQFVTKSEYGDFIRTMSELKRNTPLSQAALEVLSIIAYNQPITKAFAEQVRGVDCSGVYNSLVEKGLIEEVGRLELPGRPILYATTPLFLRSFKLTSLADLPPLPKDALLKEENETISIETYIENNKEENDAEIETESR